MDSSKTQNIRGYKPFYIQGNNDSAALNTKTSWGMIAKVNPYPLLPNPKDPYCNEWKDENGDDEYVTVMAYESIEVSVTFYVKALGTQSLTPAAEMRNWVSSFFDHVKNGYFKIYDAYTAVGYQNVRYAGYEEESFNAGDGFASSVFTITFKVNDPITRMTLTNGSIVSA